jgi:hypothetical protein
MKTFRDLGVLFAMLSERKRLHGMRTIAQRFPRDDSDSAASALRDLRRVAAKRL